MSDITRALSEIKRRAVRTDLKLYQEGVGVRAGFHKTRHVPCICITEDALREALIEMGFGATPADVAQPEGRRASPQSAIDNAALVEREDTSGLKPDACGRDGSNPSGGTTHINDPLHNVHRGW